MPLPSLSGFEVVFKVRISFAYPGYVFECRFREYRPPQIGMQNNPCCIDERQKAARREFFNLSENAGEKSFGRDFSGLPAEYLPPLRLKDSPYSLNDYF